MADTVRLKFNPQEGKDYGPQSVTDGEGYEFNFAPNQTLVIPTVAGNIAMAGNATVSFGQPTAQVSAPEVVVDDLEGTTPIV